MKRPNLAIIVTASAPVLTAGLAARTVGRRRWWRTQLDLVIGDSVPLTGGLATVGRSEGVRLDPWPTTKTPP